MVTVLGATGYTGRLVAVELARVGLPFELAGRDPERLAALAAGLGVDVRTRVFDATEPRALAAAMGPGRAVINCVGPFSELGDPVVRACIDAGAHYLDTTGEQPWMRSVHERCDDAARQAGVSVVNAMAFEYALGDCAANLAARGLATPLRSLDVVYAWRGSASSRGTRRTALRMLGTRGWILDRGRWRRRAQGAGRRVVRLAGGRRLRAVLFTAGEVVTVPRQVDVETVRGWAVVGRGAALAVPLVAPALPLALPLLRPLLEPLVTRRPDPTPAERAASRFTIRVEAEGADGGSRAIELDGRDPYELTAAIVVAGAARVLEPDAPRGVVTPVELVDPSSFLESFAARGLRVRRDEPGNGAPARV